MNEAMSDTRTAMEEAFKVVFGPKPDTIWKDDVLREEWTDEYVAWHERTWRFDTLLDAEAWTDAAMMLVPEGWDSISIRRTDDGLWHCELAGNDARMMAEDPDEFWVEAEGHSHPALAIAQAALKTQDKNDG